MELSKERNRGMLTQSQWDTQKRIKWGLTSDALKRRGDKQARHWGRVTVDQWNDLYAAFWFCTGYGQLTDCQLQDTSFLAWLWKENLKIPPISDGPGFCMSDFKLCQWVFLRNNEHRLQYLTWHMSLSASHPVVRLGSYQFCFCGIATVVFPRSIWVFIWKF